ncbi:MAG: metal ABC transporter permease [Epsilonproteobacteria bacterium]|nr:metal ABC transporter permease [Campylobacterota bacterium]
MIELFSLVPNSFYASFLISIAVGIIGSLIVINKNSFIAGSIAHGSFGGIGLAFYLSSPILLTTSIFAIFLALLLSYITLKYPNRSDAVIGAIWAIGMSIGIIFAHLTPEYNGGLISYLFGSILTISNEDISMMLGVDVMLVCFILVFYHQILLVSYDREFAQVRGLNVAFLHTLFLVLVSLSIVMSVRAIGIILVIALFTIPPFIAERFTNSLKSMMIVSSVLSLVLVVGGIMVSFYYDLPPSASIILLSAAAFFLSFLRKDS